MKVLKWLNINFEPICMSLTFYMTVALITVQVVLRFVFESGFAWGEEISRFLFVWSIFLAVPYISRNNKHVGVGLVRELCSDKIKKCMLILIDLATVYLVVVLLQGGISNVIITNEFHDRTASLDISMNWLFMAPVVGYVIMLLRTVQTLIWKVRRFQCSYELFRNPNGYYDGADNICFITSANRQELLKLHDSNAEEEEKKFHRKGAKNT